MLLTPVASTAHNPPLLAVAVVGKVDRIRVSCRHRALEISDYKTSVRVMDSTSFKGELQGKLYAAAIEAVPDFNGYSCGVEFDYVATNADPLFTKVKPEELDAVREFCLLAGNDLAQKSIQFGKWTAKDESAIDKAHMAGWANPGLTCYDLYGEPCPFIFRCPAANDLNLPPCTNTQEAEQVLGMHGAGKGLAKASREILESYFAQATSPASITAGGLTASLEKRISESFSARAVALWLSEMGRTAELDAWLEVKKSSDARLVELRGVHDDDASKRKELERELNDPNTSVTRREEIQNLLARPLVITDSKTRSGLSIVTAKETLKPKVKKGRTP
jgi:hypothetical protein